MNNKPYIAMNSLCIEVYTVGYKFIGESIIFLIKCDSVVIFSAVIDSYSYRNINKTIEILEYNKVDELDYFCWTHPDEDHSKGIDALFQKYVGKNTTINIPKDFEISYKKCSKEVIKIFEYVKKNALDDDNYNVYNVCDFQDIMAYKDDLKIIYRNRIFTLEIESIAPNSKLIRNDIFSNEFNKNNHSIALRVRLGSLIFIFAGDIENPTIKLIHQKKIPAKCVYLKIPHHGSDTSNLLCNRFEQIDVACVTSYKRGVSDLPKLDVIEQYSSKSENLFNTSDFDMNNKDDYGVIYSKFDILNYMYSNELYGNACRYSNKDGN